MKSGLIGRIGGNDHHGWASRDYLDVDCKATGCQFNRDEKCMVPSRYKIGADGRCEGFQVPPQKKIEGD
jgi:hypothetical protein